MAIQPEKEVKLLQEQGPGKTSIDDTVVAKIAGMAAREIPGVHDIGGPAQRAIGGVVQRITGTAGGLGVGVEVGQQETAVDLSLIVDYGQPIPEVANQVRQNIINQIESLTGLRVKEVNITVNDVFLPQQRPQSQAGEQHAA